VRTDERAATSTSGSGESENICLFLFRYLDNVSSKERICHQSIGRHRENGTDIRQMLSVFSLAKEHHWSADVVAALLIEFECNRKNSAFVFRTHPLTRVQQSTGVSDDCHIGIILLCHKCMDVPHLSPGSPKPKGSLLEELLEPDT
jgi:hypothetical protein